MMKNLIQSIGHRRTASTANSVPLTCKGDAPSALSRKGSNVKELVLHLPEKDYLKLSQLATQYCLTPAEYVKRRAFGRRTPRFIGAVLEQIVQTLVRIEVQLEHLIGVENSTENLYQRRMKLRPELEQSLRQLSSLIKRLERQFKL